MQGDGATETSSGQLPSFRPGSAVPARPGNPGTSLLKIFIFSVSVGWPRLLLGPVEPVKPPLVVISHDPFLVPPAFAVTYTFVQTTSNQGILNCFPQSMHARCK